MMFNDVQYKIILFNRIFMIIYSDITATTTTNYVVFFDRKIRVKVNSTMKQMTTYNAVGFIRGSEEPGKNTAYLRACACACACVHVLRARMCVQSPWKLYAMFQDG